MVAGTLSVAMILERIDARVLSDLAVCARPATRAAQDESTTRGLSRPRGGRIQHAGDRARVLLLQVRADAAENAPLRSTS